MRLVERLIAFRISVPAYIESPILLLGTLIRVRVNGAESFRRRELHLQPVLRVLRVFQPPAGGASRRRASEIATRIFQMLVAKQNFGPLAVILFENGRPRDENRRGIGPAPTRCCFL